MKTETWKILKSADDVTPEIEQHVVSCVEWFEDSPTMGVTEFIDRLCKTYGGSGYDDGDYDLDSYDSPAARKIMRLARKTRKEKEQWG